MDDTVFCAERGETVRWAIECWLLRGEKLSGGRYSVVY